MEGCEPECDQFVGEIDFVPFVLLFCFVASLLTFLCSVELL